MILNNERKRFSMDRLGAVRLFDSPELIGHPLYKELVETYREAVMKTCPWGRWQAPGFFVAFDERGRG